MCRKLSVALVGLVAPVSVQRLLQCVAGRGAGLVLQFSEGVFSCLFQWILFLFVKPAHMKQCLEITPCCDVLSQIDAVYF